MRARRFIMTGAFCSTVFFGSNAIASETSEREEAAQSIEASLASAIDTSRGLRAEDAAKRATATSFDVRAKERALDGAVAERTRTKLDFLPRLSTNARYTRLSPIDQPVAGTVVAAPSAGAGPIPDGTPLVNVPLAFPVLLNQMSAQAQLSIPVSDYLLRLSQRHAAAKEQVEAARQRAEAARRIAATNARIAYYEWIRARLQVTVSRKTLATAADHLREAKNVLSAGSGSPADVLRAESQVAQAELLIVRSQNLEADAAERLRIATHDDKLDLGLIGEDVRVDPPAFDVGGGIEGLFAEATHQRREIQALGHAARALARQAEATRALYFPRLDAVAEATYANPNQRIFPLKEEFRGTWSAGAVLSWSPNDALSAGPSARAAEAKEAETKEQLSLFRDQLRSEVVEGFHALQETKAALESTRRGVAAAEEGHRVRLALYQAGRATGTELTDAENELVRARFGLVSAYVDARLARVRLAHAVGRD